MPPLQLDVWSDLACPWCYIGKRNLERAIAARADAGPVEVVWRAFELDPRAPRVHDDATPFVARLARKYGVTDADARRMIDRVADAAARVGIELRHDRLRAGNTFDAHRLVAWARTAGAADAVAERLFGAYHTDGRAIGDAEVLVEIAADAGLDAEAARAVLAGDRFAAEVRADEALARQLGVTGVPFVVMAGRLAVPGAQPVETMVAALDRARALASPPTDPPTDPPAG